MNEPVITTSTQIKNDIPLVVDLDGTLIRSDLLIESFFASLNAGRVVLARVIRASFQGKAQLKAALASAVDIDPARLPYDRAVLGIVMAARDQGREVFLASASNEKYVSAIADHLGLFTGWFASDSTCNLSSRAKAKRLVDCFGESGFEYIGNDSADLAVWQVASKRAGIRLSSKNQRRLIDYDPNAKILPAEPSSLKDWVKLLRIHQYAKNALVFIPLLTSHSFGQGPLLASIGAFVAFCLCASSVYIINDLADIEADRSHPTKRLRPLAYGTISVLKGVLIVPVLLSAAFAIAFFVSPLLFGVLAAYFALTTAYTFFLKRKMLVDIIALAMLYTVRVIGGAAAIGVNVSEWLLAFSLFLFMSLALVKRYVELTVRLDASLPNPPGRNYQIGDLEIVAALAAASGFNAVTVFALYISSEAVHNLYTRPQLLWFICPVMIYWLSRTLMMAHRRFMHDDPLIFALKDKNSLVAGAIIVLILAAAT